MRLTRRATSLGLASSILLRPAYASQASSAEPAPVNPLVRRRADAQVFRHTDGAYYMTGSVPEYDRLVLRRSPTLAGLTTAEERVLWRHDAAGPLSGFIWAPELHLVDGQWTLYFAAGPSGGGADVFRIRTYALRCDGPDPMSGRWALLGQLQTAWDSFNLDSTSFVHRGTRYLCWAQREAGLDTNSNLYLAPLKTALTFARPPVRLSTPTLDWEVRGFKVNEAPAVLERHGRLFVTYSASATDARYCLGMLTADASADIMDANVWTKSEHPVFVSCPETSVFGPGHNSFTTDEQGRDILVYHGRDYEKIVGDPLFDPNRHTRVQRIYYRGDGVPDFGVPVGEGQVPDRYSPVTRPGQFLISSGGRLAIGGGPIAESQFRMEPSGDAFSLQPILRRDRRLVAVGPDGVALGAQETALRLRRVPGLAGVGVSFLAADRAEAYLRVTHDRLELGPAQADADRRSATFLAS